MAVLIPTETVDVFSVSAVEDEHGYRHEADTPVGTFSASVQRSPSRADTVTPPGGMNAPDSVRNANLFIDLPVIEEGWRVVTPLDGVVWVVAARALVLDPMNNSATCWSCRLVEAKP